MPNQLIQLPPPSVTRENIKIMQEAIMSLIDRGCLDLIKDSMPTFLKICTVDFLKYANKLGQSFPVHAASQNKINIALYFLDLFEEHGLTDYIWLVTATNRTLLSLSITHRMDPLTQRLLTKYPNPDLFFLNTILPETVYEIGAPLLSTIENDHVIFAQLIFQFILQDPDIFNRVAKFDIFANARSPQMFKMLLDGIAQHYPEKKKLMLLRTSNVFGQTKLHELCATSEFESAQIVIHHCSELINIANANGTRPLSTCSEENATELLGVASLNGSLIGNRLDQNVAHSLTQPVLTLALPAIPNIFIITHPSIARFYYYEQNKLFRLFQTIEILLKWSSEFHNKPNKISTLINSISATDLPIKTFHSLLFDLKKLMTDSELPIEDLIATINTAIISVDKSPEVELIPIDCEFTILQPEIFTEQEQNQKGIVQRYFRLIFQQRFAHIFANTENNRLEALSDAQNLFRENSASLLKNAEASLLFVSDVETRERILLFKNRIQVANRTLQQKLISDFQTPEFVNSVLMLGRPLPELFNKLENNISNVFKKYKEMKNQENAFIDIKTSELDQQITTLNELNENRQSLSSFISEIEEFRKKLDAYNQKTSLGKLANHLDEHTIISAPLILFYTLGSIAFFTGFMVVGGLTIAGNNTPSQKRVGVIEILASIFCLALNLFLAYKHSTSGLWYSAHNQYSVEYLKNDELLFLEHIISSVDELQSNLENSVYNRLVEAISKIEDRLSDPKNQIITLNFFLGELIAAIQTFQQEQNIQKQSISWQHRLFQPQQVSIIVRDDEYIPLPSHAF